jgi:hypothetical protein
VVVVAGDVAVGAVDDFAGVWLKVSQIDGPLPSAVAPPSIWNALVATPQVNEGGNCVKSVIFNKFVRIEMEDIATFENDFTPQVTIRPQLSASVNRFGKTRG